MPDDDLIEDRNSLLSHIKTNIMLYTEKEIEEACEILNTYLGMDVLEQITATKMLSQKMYLKVCDHLSSCRSYEVDKYGKIFQYFYLRTISHEKSLSTSPF